MTLKRSILLGSLATMSVFLFLANSMYSWPSSQSTKTTTVIKSSPLANPAPQQLDRTFPIYSGQLQERVFVDEHLRSLTYLLYFPLSYQLSNRSPLVVLLDASIISGSKSSLKSLPTLFQTEPTASATWPFMLLIPNNVPPTEPDLTLMALMQTMSNEFGGSISILIDLDGISAKDLPHANTFFSLLCKILDISHFSLLHPYISSIIYLDKSVLKHCEIQIEAHSETNTYTTNDHKKIDLSNRFREAGLAGCQGFLSMSQVVNNPSCRDILISDILTINKIDIH